MVKALHRENIEVILDVVYNHTGEAISRPMLNFRGIDNSDYYRLVPEMPRFYMDYTGTGILWMCVIRRLSSSLWTACDTRPRKCMSMVSALISPALWLANCTTWIASRRFSTSFIRTRFCPRLKLIAEPWDVGEGGYQVGNFPVLWAEWNGKYRDTVRRYWKGDEGQLSDLAYRLTGRSDLYKGDGRKPSASINFITAHDGFTLHDLVSYNEKHNIANGEENHDGTNDNHSWNMGVEGPADDPGQSKRSRQVQMRTSWRPFCSLRACP